MRQERGSRVESSRIRLVHDQTKETENWSLPGINLSCILRRIYKLSGLSASALRAPSIKSETSAQSEGTSSSHYLFKTLPMLILQLLNQRVKSKLSLSPEALPSSLKKKRSKLESFVNFKKPMQSSKCGWTRASHFRIWSQRRPFLGVDGIDQDRDSKLWAVMVVPQ